MSSSGTTLRGIFCLQFLLLVLAKISTAQFVDFLDLGVDSPVNAIWKNRYRGNNDNECYLDGESHHPHHTGVCMKSSTCRYHGGTPYGRSTCGIWNTCCDFNRRPSRPSRPSSSTPRVIHFNSPPNARDRPFYEVHVDLLPNAYQLRVDIKNMNLLVPTADTDRRISKCMDDKFTVSPRVNDAIPDICGKQKDQHFYIHLRDSKDIRLDRITFSIRLAEDRNQLDNPTWDITITQLESPYNGHSSQNKRYKNNKNNSHQLASDFQRLAPAGCLQYFTEPWGEFYNFGFISDSDTTLTTNQDYGICFKREPGSCGVSLTTEYFKLRDIEASECKTEYLVIPGEKHYCELSPNILIGYQTTGPLHIQFVSIAPVAGMADEENPGFHFKYDSLPCRSPFE